MTVKRESLLPSIAETESVSGCGTPTTPTTPEESSEKPSRVEHSTPSPTIEIPQAPEKNAGQPGKSQISSWFWKLISLFFSVLWLAPIITILVFNFEERVIGASVWCPLGRCASNAFDPDAIAKAVEYDKDDHNVLTGLQFVAQAFEIWFLIISAGLLYDISMLFARSKGGLPVGFLLNHLEFKDITFLFSPGLWTSAFPRKGASRHERRRKNTSKLFIFALLAAFVTIITTLMDAAIAVLLLPSLSWIETEHIPQQRFEDIAIGQPPQGDVVFAGSCSSPQLHAGNYSCTSDLYASSLDEWAATALSSLKQYEHSNGIPILATSQEAAVQFALNSSKNLNIAWAANRQVLRDISNDYLNAVGLNQNRLSEFGVADNGSADPTFRSSLQTILQRTGPSMGVEANCMAGNVSVTRVASGKEVHCFSQWSLDGVNNYTKCLRIGRGFNINNNQSRFWLDADEADSSAATPVDSLFSDLVTFYNSTTDFGSGIIRCLANDTAPKCDWDKIFSVSLPTELQNFSLNAALISYSFPNTSNSQARIYCDSTAYLSFPKYSLDTSPSSNGIHLVQLDHFDETGNPKAPLIVSPDWYLAAWSVDRNGTVDSTRSIAKNMKNALSLFWNDQNETNGLQLLFYHTYAIGQAMSMVNYYNVTPTAEQAAMEGDPHHPIFITWAQLHVWAWGLSAKTSKLGVVITICGCVIVLGKVLLSIYLIGRGDSHHSPTELVTAALQHVPDDAFEGLGGENEKARVRYIIKEDQRERRLRFVQVQREVRGDGNID